MMNDPRSKSPQKKRTSRCNISGIFGRLAPRSANSNMLRRRMRLEPLEDRRLLTALLDTSFLLPEFGGDGSTGTVVGVDSPINQLGRSVSSIGDLNGDGIDDFVLGANRVSEAGAVNTGESYVIFGSNTGLPAALQLEDLDGSDGFVIRGLAASDQSGHAVGSAGDFNNDGIADLIIGAREGNPDGNNLAGESYVVFGRNDGFGPSLELSSLDGSNGFVIHGASEEDHFGSSVGSAGDVNDDGISDLIIGASRASVGSNELAGKSYVIFGTTSEVPALMRVADLDGNNGFEILGIASGDRSGHSVSGIGDLNNDGVSDIVIGAPQANSLGSTDEADRNAGESYVIFGHGNGFSAGFELSTLDGNNGLIIHGSDADDQSGFSVSSAGDINGDGISDLLIGAPLADPHGQARAGRGSVVFGRDGGFSATLDLETLDGNNGFNINGIDAQDIAGFAVSHAGDVNGDNLDDLLIGARGADGTGGESYLIFGSAVGFSAELDLSTLGGSNGFTIKNVDGGDRFGESVDAAGDINQDGFDDLLIGAPRANGFRGEGYLLLGRDFSIPQAGNDLVTLDQNSSVTIDILANDNDIDGAIDPSSVTITTPTEHGSVSINQTTGEATYTPSADFAGSDSFVYQVRDDEGKLSNEARVSFLVVSLNESPTAFLDLVVTQEESPITFDVTVNDLDSDGMIIPSSVTIVTPPQSGQATVDPVTGLVTYSPEQDVTGEFTFSYTVEDNLGAISNAASVFVTITGVNDPPVAGDVSAITSEDEPVDINVLISVTDIDNAVDPTSIDITINPINGNVELDAASGNITYTPHENFTGIDSFGYTIRDADGAISNEAIVSVAVQSVNDVPVAVDDQADSLEDTPVTIEILNNDEDVDGTIDPATVVITQDPAHGSASINSDGSITYQPNEEFSGTDELRYTVRDNHGAITNEALVMITVTEVNDAPIASDDTVSTPESIPVTVDILSNDHDVDGTLDPASVTVITDPQNGTVSVDSDTGRLLYSPNPGFSGSETIVYTVSDDLGAVSNEATVTISVTNPPVAMDDQAETDEENATSIDLLSNDEDSDGLLDPATVAITQEPGNGSVTIDPATGIATYTPGENFAGVDTFHYTVDDDDAQTSNTAIVTVTVIQVNDSPIAVDDTASTDEDTPVTIDVLVNDTDIEDMTIPMLVTITSSPNSGSVSVDSLTGQVTYTPAENFSGSDSFGYTATDSDGAVSNEATVSITIDAVNDAPLAVDDLAVVMPPAPPIVAGDAMIEDARLQIPQLLQVAPGATVEVPIVVDDATGLLGINLTVEYDSSLLSIDSSDITLGGLLTHIGGWSIVSNVDNSAGTASLAIFGTAPASGGFGQIANLAFQVAADANEVTSPLVITGPEEIGNRMFRYDNGSVIVKDPTIKVDVLSNDSDVDGTIDSGTVAITEAPANGTVIVNGDGTVDYTPAPNFFGEDTFRYTVADELGEVSDEAVVTIVVAGAEPGFQNPGNRFDVDDNKIVNAADLLKLIRDINDNGNRNLAPPSPGQTPPFVDINGDNIVNPLDVVLLITELNRLSKIDNNNAPEIGAPLDDITVDEDSSDLVIDLSNVFIDEDIISVGDHLSITVENNSNPSLVSVSLLGPMVLSFAAGQSGVAEITLRACDSMGAFIDETFLVTVNHENHAPVVLRQLDDVLVNEDSTDVTIDLAGLFDDVDIDTAGDSLALNISGNSNPGLVSTSIGQDLTLSFAADESGTAAITVRATDQAGLFAEQAFQVTVLSVMSDVQLSVAEEIEAVAGTSISVPVELVSGVNLIGANLTITYDTSNLDLADVSLGSLLVNAGGWSLIENTDEAAGTSSLALFGSAPLSAGGGEALVLTFDVAASASDGLLDIELSGPANIAGISFDYVDGSLLLGPPINHLPFVTRQIADVTVDEDAAPVVIDLSGTFDDQDLGTGDSLSLSLVGNTNPSLVSTVLTDDLTLIFTDDAFGTAELTLRATDDAGAFADQSFTVTVQPMAADVTIQGSEGIAAVTGGRVELPILIDHATGLQGMNINLTYDTASLDLNNMNVTLGSLLANAGGWSIVSNVDDAAGTASIAIFSGTPLAAADGEIAVLGFDVENNASIGESIIDLSGPANVGGFDFNYNNGSLIISAGAPVNHSPTVVGPLSDVTVEVGVSQSNINIDSVFDDADLGSGDQLTLSVAGNTNESLVTASLNGALTLDYAAGMTGQAEITLRATDTEGAFVEDSFFVTVEPAIPSTADLHLSLPADFPAVPGSSIEVPIQVDNAAGLQGFNLVVTYDTSLLDLTNADVQLGDLFVAAGGWSLITNVNDMDGTAAMALFTIFEMQGGSGDVVTLNFDVAANAKDGSTPLGISGPTVLGDLEFGYIGGNILIEDSPEGESDLDAILDDMAQDIADNWGG